MWSVQANTPIEGQATLGYTPPGGALTPIVVGPMTPEPRQSYRTTTFGLYDQAAENFNAVLGPSYGVSR